jgi:serine/threonine-protein kinase
MGNETDPLAATMSADTVSGTERPVLGERYELLGLLGAGGMGNVYKARDLELDEIVALKVLKPELVGEAGALERFRREVKLARRVTHPNVARVFDIGERGGEKILTMELVEGEALSSEIVRGPLSVARTLEVAQAICAGVGAAHAAGVIHRDLKPDNVLIGRDGRVVVADFGIARAASATKTLGSFVGTPTYMAPEQVEDGSADGRSDVYAFGAMLYEMLVGEPPWTGDSVFAVAAARLLKPPPDPRAKRPDIPVVFAESVLKCMARRPEDRFASMSAVATALASITPPRASARSVPPPAPEKDAGRRVAVLPFKNLGPADQEYVADGLTEDLIDTLSVARGLRVRSRGVVMPFKNTDRDARDIGRELDAQVIVEGSIKRGPGTFRIAARLLSVADGIQLWARRFDGTDAELLAKNDEVARAVAEALAAQIEGAPRAAASSAEDVDLYLRARDAYYRSFSGDKDLPMELFGRLVARTPNDARALAGFAMARTHQFRADQKTRDAIRAAFTRAIELAPSLPEGHVAEALFAFFIEGDHPASMRATRRALRLAPNSVEGNDIAGRLLTEAGDPRGIVHVDKALALEPEFEFPRLMRAASAALDRDWDTPVALLGDPRASIDRMMMPHVWARLLMWKRDEETARVLCSKLPPPQTEQDFFARAMLTVILEHARPPMKFPDTPDVAHGLQTFFAECDAEFALYLGDEKTAIETLHRLDRLGHGNLNWLDKCPLVEAVRPHPDFPALRARTAKRAAATIAAFDAAE